MLRELFQKKQKRVKIGESGMVGWEGGESRESKSVNLLLTFKEGLEIRD